MTNSIATLLLTRPRAASEAFLTAFKEAIGTNISPLVSPLIEIVPTGDMPNLTDVQGVIFTSEQGIIYGGPAGDIPAFCVGPSTTEAALKAGWTAQQTGNTAESLANDLIQMRPKGPLLHIGGLHRRGSIAQKLSDAGLKTIDISVYDQQLLPLSKDALSALERETVVVVPLFSPRTARQFAQQAGRCTQVHIVAISSQVLLEVAGVDAKTCSVARTPDRNGMMEMLKIVLGRVEAT